MEKRLSVREARRSITQLMKGNEAVAIGDAYKLRAIIVPIPAWDHWNERTRHAAKRAARKAFNAALAKQIG